MPDNKKFKEFFDRDLVRFLSRQFEHASTTFQATRFEREATEIAVGDPVHLLLTLENHSAISADVRVDYLLEGPTQSGPQFRKIFRWKDLHLTPGESESLDKTHHFRDLTIRKITPGPHWITPLVNGIKGPRIAVQIKSR